MENENNRALLSQKYIEVLATLQGHQTISDPTDPAFIRIREKVERKLPKGKRAFVFSNREIRASILSYPENQVRQAKGKTKFSVEPSLYNEIIETATRQRPTALFICTWPAAKEGTVIFSKEAMSMICTGYWFLPGKKSKSSGGTKNVTIEVPDDQIIDAKAFEKIFDQIYI
ncbi:MAG: hypothetical protein AAFZ15_10390 [Bacteroidota bacterium]